MEVEENKLFEKLVIPGTYVYYVYYIFENGSGTIWLNTSQKASSYNWIIKARESIEHKTGVSKVSLVSWKRMRGEEIKKKKNTMSFLISTIKYSCIALENIEERSIIELFSDSEYVIKTMNGQFKKSKNLDFWERLEKASSFHNKVTWKWIRGHSGNTLHDACDTAARYIARNKKVNDFYIMNLF